MRKKKKKNYGLTVPADLNVRSSFSNSFFVDAVSPPDAALAFFITLVVESSSAAV